MGPNVVGLEQRYGFSPREFRLWLALHEVTHRCQFTGVPWLRDHFLSLVDAGLEPMATDPARLTEAVRRAAEELRAGHSPMDDAGMIGLVATPEQLEAIQRIQALMSLLEGHGDVTMDRAGAEAVPGAERFSRVLRERRQRSGARPSWSSRFSGWRPSSASTPRARSSSTAVEAAGGPDLFDRVWRGPEWLPVAGRDPRPRAVDRPGPLGTGPGRLTAGPVAAGRPPPDAAGPWGVGPVAAGGHRRCSPGARSRRPGTGLCCAVSGGPDSLALLVLAVAAGCRVEAVHVDHGLRPGSADEADVVAGGGPALRGRVPLPSRVEVADGPNLEARARAARYAALPADVATGHTMDDQAETVLANLLRGAGLDGLAGMRPGSAPPAAGPAPRRDPGRVPGPRPASRSRTRPTTTRGTCATGSATSCCRLCAELAGRDPVPVLARQAAVLRDEADLLDELARAAVPDPADRTALAAAPGRWPAGPSGGGCASRRRARPGRPGPGPPVPTRPRPPRWPGCWRWPTGRVRATELSGGRRVARTGGRLVTSEVEPSGKVTPMQTEESPPATPAWASPEIGPVVVGAPRRLQARVAELGAAITADYADGPPCWSGVLKGAMMFISDLARAIALPVDVDFMAVSSYGSATRTSGVVRIVKDLDADLAGRHVLVVEDIIDSGLTLNYLRRYLQARDPASVEICALLVKEGEQRVELDLRYVGFTIPSRVRGGLRPRRRGALSQPCLGPRLPGRPGLAAPGGSALTRPRGGDHQ